MPTRDERLPALWAAICQPLYAYSDCSRYCTKRSTTILNPQTLVSLRILHHVESASCAVLLSNSLECRNSCCHLERLTSVYSTVRVGGCAKHLSKHGRRNHLSCNRKNLSTSAVRAEGCAKHLSKHGRRYHLSCNRKNLSTSAVRAEGCAKHLSKYERRRMTLTPNALRSALRPIGKPVLSLSKCSGLAGSGRTGAGRGGNEPKCRHSWLCTEIDAFVAPSSQHFHLNGTIGRASHHSHADKRTHEAVRTSALSRYTP